MSLFRRAVPASDDALIRRIERGFGGTESDPLYRRRLRGAILNQYVAARERPGAAPRRPTMGRLGRSCLYASLALAIGTTGVGAVSQDALPGEILYPLKREIEEIRFRVAPAPVRAELVGMVLEERLLELQRLATAGDWDLVPASVAEVTATSDLLVDLGGMPLPRHVAQIIEHIAVLTQLLDTAPPAALDGLRRALVASDPFSTPPESSGRSESPGRSADSPGHGAGAPAVAPSTDTDGSRPADAAEPSPSARPSHAPRLPESQATED